MRAVVLEEYGDPDVLRVVDVPAPEPGPEEVLVEVVSTGVNRAEVLQRMGRYPHPGARGRHEIPGLEFAGRVVARGERVTEWNLGDEVMGIVTGGGYAERVAVHERQAVPVPGTVGVRDAGVIPEVWITAFDALIAQGGLRPGETALIHAGASGVGTAAIQLAKAVGATVAVTASTQKLASCQALGADLAIDYTVDDFVDAVHQLTGGRGADVVLDVVGGEYFARNIAAVATHGRIVQVGSMGGAKGTIDIGRLMTKRAHIIGTVLRARPVEEKIAISQRFAREVLPWFERGVCRPVIDSRFTLDQLPGAHRHMEANANVGKILIEVVA